MACRDIRINGVTLRKVRVGSIKVDHTYQRGVDERKVKRMIDRWDEESVGVPVVSERDDGLYAVDGQHRIAAYVVMGKADKEIAVDVRRGLTRKQEADLFYKLNGPNGQTAVRAYFKFRARLVAEDPTAVEINNTLRSLGLRVTEGPTKMGVAAVQSVERIHRTTHNLKETLSVLVELSRCYNHDPAAYEKKMIEAVGWFLADFPSADRTTLVQKLRLAAGKNGPSGIINALDHQRRVWRDEPSRSCVVGSVLEMYNKRNRKPLTRDDLVRGAD